MERFGSGSGTSIIRRKDAEQVLSVPRDAYPQAEPDGTHAVFLRLCASALSVVKTPKIVAHSNRSVL